MKKYANSLSLSKAPLRISDYTTHLKILTNMVDT
jgi:hypothetical protein